MARGRYLSLEEERKAGTLKQFAVTHRCETVRRDLVTI